MWKLLVELSKVLAQKLLGLHQINNQTFLYYTDILRGILNVPVHKVTVSRKTCHPIATQTHYFDSKQTSLCSHAVCRYRLIGLGFDQDRVQTPSLLHSKWTLYHEATGGEYSLLIFCLICGDCQFDKLYFQTVQYTCMFKLKLQIWFTNDLQILKAILNMLKNDCLYLFSRIFTRKYF